MERETTTFSIKDLKSGAFHAIDFPEYQREPTVWNREQKQRLIDSILRRFDIAAIYLYERDDNAWECIDGRQRLNAIMSFLGENPADEDNGFRLRIQNEIAEDTDPSLEGLDGKTFDELGEWQDAILDYEVITVVLSGSRAPEEFNLQFLRLNLGALINAGEKLHAMVGVMRDVLFADDGLGKHPFLKRVRVPTRRFARELIAAQFMLELSSKAKTDAFTAARHFDLQRYLKLYADREDLYVGEASATLGALEESGPELGSKLSNRAICVSVLLAAWELEIRNDRASAEAFSAFVSAFIDRLAYQVERMKEFNIDARFDYLVEFQRHLTQAAVEKPAVTYRHKTLIEKFEFWKLNGRLPGEEED